MDTSSLLVSNSSAKALLLDQTSRIDQHKANFDALKVEYLKLQEMCDKLQHENKKQSHNFSDLVSKSENIIYQVQKDRDERVKEYEQLKSQVLTPEKIFKLKNKLANEMEQTYREHIQSLEMELHVRINEYEKLKRNYNLVKLEFENKQSVSNTRLKEVIKEHDSQVSMYKQQIKDLNEKLKRDVPNEIHQTRQLQRSNTQLEERIKQLLNENKCLRDKLHEVEIAKDQEIRSLKQQHVHLNGVIEQMNSDKQSLCTQLKRYENDIELSEKEQISLTETLQKTQTDLINCQRKLDDVIHQCSRDKDDLIMNNLREVQSLQDERNKYLKEIEQYKLQISSLQNSIKFLDTTVNSKTQELADVKEKISQDHLETQLHLEKEKGNYEQQIGNMQSLLISKCQDYDKTISELKDQVSSIETEKESFQSECDILRSELEQKVEILNKNTKELNQLKELKILVTSLRSEKEILEESNVQLTDEIAKVKQEIKVIEQHRNTTLSEIKLLTDKHQHEILELKSERQEIESNYKFKENELSLEITKLQDKISVLKKKNNKLKKQYELSLNEVQNIIDLTSRKEKESQEENERLRKSVDEVKKTMRNKLQSYHKRHQEFILLLNTNPNQRDTVLHDMIN